MKRQLFIYFLLILFALRLNCVFASEISAETSALSNHEIRAQLNKIKTKRIIIANALLLNEAQIKKAEDIYSKIVEKEAIQLVQLRKEQDVLKNMTKENSKYDERKAQRKIIHSLSYAIQNSENQADKEFKKILTHDQRVKFNRLKKQIIISDF